MVAISALSPSVVRKSRLMSVMERFVVLITVLGP